MKESYDGLVISGGGLYGIAYLGIIKKMEEAKKIQNIKEYAGTSIGSILCIFLSLGKSSDEILEILKNNTIIDKKQINIKDCWFKMGIDDCQLLVEIIKKELDQITKKTNITFNELYIKTNKKVTITGVELQNQDVIYFNHEMTPNMNVIDAIRISCSIPFIFTPYKLDSKLYVDGGLLNNVPINVINQKSILILKTNSKKEIREINNLFELLLIIINICKQKLDCIVIDDETMDMVSIRYKNDVPFFTYEYKKYIDILFEYGYNYLKM